MQFSPTRVYGSCHISEERCWQTDSQSGASVKIDPDPRTITRVALRNYKSIAACNIELAPLTILIGSNGAGKSNFLDALQFTAEALLFSLNDALRRRGGIGEVRRRSSGHQDHFGVRLDFRLPEATGWYAFEIGERDRGAYVLRREECHVHSSRDGVVEFFRVENGSSVATSLAYPPTADSGLLYLMRASAMREFRSIYRALSSMGVYNIEPRKLGGFQAPTGGEPLAKDGSNAASVLAHLEARVPRNVERIIEYLSVVVPDMSKVESHIAGNRLALRFHHKVSGNVGRARRFLADNESDGTLRFLGVLLALFQDTGGSTKTRVTGVEQPEAVLHPAAAGVLVDVLLEASERSQVIVTTHSADLLDRDSIPVESIFPVVSQAGESMIGPLDDTSRSVLQAGSFTGGELLRIGQLHPKLDVAAPKPVGLFGKE